MRRLAHALVLMLALALAPAALATPAAPAAASASWADAQIKTVVATGLMAPTVQDFRADDPLTAGELAEILTALGETAAPPADPSAPVTVSSLHAALVKHLGLTPAAKQFRTALVAAGLKPSKRAGTDLVARMIGLRTNHSTEALELGPGDPVTRAETAFSLARVLALGSSYELATIKAQASAFALPELSEWQQRVLARAVGLIGYPYVWAGSSEKPQTLFSGPVPAGFDCSGFVWRVYKLEPYPDAPQLASTLKGRTTYAMSAEVPASTRIPKGALAPADLVFFGDNGRKSKPAQIGHMGIYLGNGWFIHSSSTRGGIIVSTLEGWYADRFAWGRRPLAEAGLEAPAPAPAPEPAATADPAAPTDPGDVSTERPA